MPTVTFSRAVRKGTHIIITAYGESGCGKTYSLILLGRGLVGPKGKLGLIDTETGRGLIYANVAGGYEYAALTPPFTPERYVEAIDAAEDAGIEALVLDSGSHEWEGLGGILEIADAQTSRSGSELQGLIKWAKPKARHKRYVQRLLNSRMHLLISLRAKEKMIQLTDKMPLPKGMRVGDIISAGHMPIQDKRFIFETTVQLFLPVYDDRRRLGIPIVEKCPEDLLGAFPEGRQIGEETGQRIAEWVNGGEPVDHDFERLKRAAEDAAGNGTAALRQHWGELNKATRSRLDAQIDNLSSIARAADQEAESRQREQQQSRNSFRHDESHTASADGPPERSRADEAAQSDGPDLGGSAPAASAPLLDRVSPEENLSVPKGAPDYVARTFLAMIAEAPDDWQRKARIRLANEARLRELKQTLPAAYTEIMAALRQVAQEISHG